jgi:hypothetical protein
MGRVFIITKKFWFLFLQKFGKVNTMILLSIVYIGIIGPMALLTRLFGRDLLDIKNKKCQVSYWRVRPLVDQTIERQKYQF